MTDTDDALDAISRAATELVPELTDRLARHGLGEIEVSRGDLRLRVVAGVPIAPQPHGDSSPMPTAVDAVTEERPAAPVPGVSVASPAVGFFVYADGLGPGLDVGKGDAVGHVEMLGVRHDVRAPRAGTVRHLVAESGEAVEYGQVVVELEPVEANR